MDRTGRLGCDVAGDPPWEGELPEQTADALGIAADSWIDLAVGALKVRIGNDARPAVAGADDVDRIEIPVPDDPVHVRVDEVQPGCGAPVPEQAWLDVFRTQGFSQQRIVQQVDLARRQVVGGPPVGIDQARLIGGEWTILVAGRGRGRSRRTYGLWGSNGHGCLRVAIVGA